MAAARGIDLACWTSSAGSPAQMAAMLTDNDLRDLRGTGAVEFRVAVHHGTVTFGGFSDFRLNPSLASTNSRVFPTVIVAAKSWLDC
jgi:hypothetical protein